MPEDLPPPAIRPEQVPKRKNTVRPRLVAAVLALAALVVFVVQNNDTVAVSWLVVKVNWPLWAVIVASAVLGAIVGEALRWILKRARRRRR